MKTIVVLSALWATGLMGVLVGAGVPIALAYSVPGPLSLALHVDPLFLPMLVIGAVVFVGSSIAIIAALKRA